MFGAGDPVRTGLVASLARPGGNITGLSMVSPEIDAKRLAFAARSAAGRTTHRRAREFDQP